MFFYLSIRTLPNTVSMRVDIIWIGEIEKRKKLFLSTLCSANIRLICLIRPKELITISKGKGIDYNAEHQ